MVRITLLLLLVACMGIARGQQTAIGGRVLDAQKQALPGVSIRIKGTSQGTTTNENGNFSVRAAQNDTLVFFQIGMARQEIVYKGQKTIEVIMKNDGQQLEEVVVIGYQTVKKANLTGAVSVFKPDEMKNTIVTGTVGDALVTVPGINVRSSGAPGSEGKVEIRGTGTFGNNNPLYVVDGVISGANRDFNFNDIETIQVLKDASAAAIYGSRAGNGVIIITTKKGREGAMKIDVSSRLTTQWLPRYNLTNRGQWIKLNDLAFMNAIADGNPNLNGLANHFEADTDWQEEVFKNGAVQDHNISFSGGGKASRYFISGNYQGNTGTTIGTKSERFTLRSNTSASRDFGKHVQFTIGENIILSHFGVDQMDTNPIIDVYRMLPTIPIRDSRNYGGYGFGNGTYDITFGSNPFAKEDFTDTRNSNLRIRGNAFTELEVVKMFKYRFNFGFDISNDRYRYLRKIGSWQANQPQDPSSLNRNQGQSREFVFDNTLEFNRKFGRHGISAVAGISFQPFFYEQVWGTKNGVLTNSLTGEYYDQLNATLVNPRTGSYLDESKLFSVFGRVNYDFDERYLLSFTMRRDESSRFAPQHRAGYFPSVAGGWRISKENFFDVSWIDDLKLRANYGILGTSNIGFWDWVALVNAFPQAVFGDNTVVSGMTQVQLINEDLKWEKLSQLNLGADASMFKNRLNVSAEYFLKVTRDVLTPMQILRSTGNNGGNPFVNAATLENRGVELALSWRDKIGRDFGYNIDVNGSYLKNKIRKLGYDRQRFTQWNTMSVVGSPVGEWYLIKTGGLFRSEEEVMSHRNSQGKLIQPNAKPGDIRYIDYNDDGMITDADRQHAGSTIPSYQLGMNLGFSYKGFDLQVQMTGAFGHKIFNGPRNGFDSYNDNSNYRADYDPWTPQNPNAADPRPIFGDSRNSRADQDRWLENGNYVRIKQIALGYNLPKSLLGKAFDSARFYVNGQNLFTFTSYTGLDPEFLNTNIWDRTYDGGAFPTPRGITFGTQLSF
ncbi:SusC/RagA family TonB-linked outer membrane protein [Pararcticibacter amylolyticus]|uniref:SusC/RagA family TonB-linked outer membrane protein n=1 Tax=Pararcticibacter amylolyticus TaxID=2173175 RepID=A0A2U2PBR1_9SPHI|nr:TonB-dependent receptor [Pararcticibacter amylolyticus]PWG78559.1 SusC/RagA family TonB-linked outer membrane protein [Pararcticibacter amylolyticus]